MTITVGQQFQLRLVPVFRFCYIRTSKLSFYDIRNYLICFYIHILTLPIREDEATKSKRRIREATRFSFELGEQRDRHGNKIP